MRTNSRVNFATTLTGGTVLCLQLLISGCRAKETDMYIIPNSYKGKVIVIYGDKTGEHAISEGLRHVFKIPASGLLRTSFPRDSLSNDPEFFMLTKDGKREKMVNMDVMRNDPNAFSSVVTYMDPREMIVVNLKDTFIVSQNSNDSMESFSFKVTDITDLN